MLNRKRKSNPSKCALWCILRLSHSKSSMKIASKLKSKMMISMNCYDLFFMSLVKAVIAYSFSYLINLALIKWFKFWIRYKKTLECWIRKDKSHLSYQMTKLYRYCKWQWNSKSLNKYRVWYKKQNRG